MPASSEKVTEAHTVVLAGPKGPLVKLDDKHYKLVDKMEALTEAPPSLLHADSLTVKGPVRFLPGTSISGDVLITNGGGLSRLLLLRTPSNGPLMMYQTPCSSALAAVD
jgi:UTP--glucose-1-phosphate uridylyltransferase/phosphoglucomutase